MFGKSVRLAKNIRPYDVIRIDRSKFEVFFIATIDGKTSLHLRNLRTNIIMTMTVEPSHPITTLNKK